MYLPQHFEESRPERLHGFMTAYPLGLLVTQSAAGVVANPIPFWLLPKQGDKGTLIGHVARTNPVWKETPSSSQALVVFQGPQGYVSPAWYASKAEHGKVVPTWNYSTVQARGPLVVHDSIEAVRAVVHTLTTHHESSQRQPWAMRDAPADYIEQLLRAIVMIELPITALVGKFKLSQNRSGADRLGVESGLAERDEAELQAMMQSAREVP